jgi:hypothetical protein
MKTITKIFILAVLVSLALTGCRKEDVTPQFDYVGGTQAEAERVEEPETGTPVQYTTLDLSDVNCSPDIVGQGFIDSMEGFITHLQVWCPNPAVPNVDFGENFIAYFGETTSGCDNVELKGIQTDGEIISIKIQIENLAQGCPCTEQDKKWREILVVERVEGATPEFVQTVVEKPCP